MEHFTTTERICGGKFLFSSDYVILATNGTHNANIQVHHSCFRNGVSGKKKTSKVAELPLSGEATTMELCSIPRLSKTYAALARTTASNSTISMVEVLASSSSASLNYNVAQDNIDVSSELTSLAFQPENELLAASTENGCLIVFDVSSGKEVCRVSAGDKRIRKVKFLRNSQLVTIGDDNKAQVKIWDLKTKNNAGTVTLSREVSCKCFMPSSSSQKTNQAQYSCINVHPSQDKLFCGTGDGSVVMWDIRKTDESNVVFRPHFTSVSEVCVHPSESNLVISSSADGSVKYFNHSDYRATAMAQQTSLVEKSSSSSSSSSDKASGPFSTLIDAEASFSGLDVDVTGGSVLAYTGSGLVYTSSFH